MTKYVTLTEPQAFSLKVWMELAPADNEDEPDPAQAALWTSLNKGERRVPVESVVDALLADTDHRDLWWCGHMGRSLDAVCRKVGVA